MKTVSKDELYDSKVYIWGCGKYGMLQAMYLESEGFEIEAFIDNDTNKSDKEIIDNIYCIAPSDVILTGVTVCIISVRIVDVDALCDQAKSIGFTHILRPDFNILDAYSDCLDDKTYLERIWKIKQGYELNLDNPITFNEKLQWLKLYNRRRVFSKMVDKYEVKSYVAEKIGSQYIVPTLGVWDNVDEIDFDDLPNSFVLKCTHDSGGVVVCRSKIDFDCSKARLILNKNLGIDFYKQLREWPYKYVKPRVLAEEFLEDNEDGELRDYKLYTFNGKVKYMLLASNRQSKTEELAFDYFDNAGNHLNLVNHWHPNAKVVPHLPKNYLKMIELAEILAEGIPHVRVDFYEANGNIFFGELTFFDMGGFLRLHPDDWDKQWGDLINLPSERIEE